MKSEITIIIILLLNISLFGQVENINTAKYSLAKKTFENEYEKTNYSKISKEKILVLENKVIIDGIEIEITPSLSPELKKIISRGFIRPNQILGSVCCLNELILLNPSPQIKRFSFWTFPIRIENRINSISVDYILSTRVNPDEYYIELENEDADENTNLNDFIDGATLTYFKHIGIVM